MPATTKTEPTFFAFDPIDKSFCLEQLCTSNYQKLFKLIPGLPNIQGTATGFAPRQSELHVVLIDRSIYTLTLRLSYCFEKNQLAHAEPDVIVRVYLDAQLAEVLSDHTRERVSQVFKPESSIAIMNYKWRLNYFLQKWLDLCLSKNYQFDM